MSNRIRATGLLATMYSALVVGTAVAAGLAGGVSLSTAATAIEYGLGKVVVQNPNLMANPLIVVGGDAIRHIVVDSPQLLANPVIVMGED